MAEMLDVFEPSSNVHQNTAIKSTGTTKGHCLSRSVLLKRLRGKELWIKLKRCDQVPQNHTKNPYLVKIKEEKVDKKEIYRYTGIGMSVAKLEGDSFVCGHCNNVFGNEEDLKNHQRRYKIGGYGTRFAEFRNKCFCDVVLWDENLKAKHIEKVEGIKYVCQICDKRLSSLCLYACHEINHGMIIVEEDIKFLYELAPSDTGVKQFCDSDCNLRPAQAAVPKPKQMGTRNLFICMNCDEEFVCRDELTKHKAEKHPKENTRAERMHKNRHPLSLACTLCPAVYTHTRPFRDHLYQDHGVCKSKNYCCKCMVMFDTKDEYCEHKMEMKDPARCEKCNLTFYTVCSIAQHGKCF